MEKQGKIYKFKVKMNSTLKRFATGALLLLASAQTATGQFLGPQKLFEINLNLDGDLVVADVDSDGLQDIITNAGRLIWVSNPTGQPKERVYIDDPTNEPLYFKVADDDLDGDPDIFTWDNHFKQIIRFENNNGLFTQQTYLTIPRVYSLAVGDLDGDGDLDKVFTAASGSKTALYWVRENGAPAQALLITDTLSAGSIVQLADLDGNQAPDFFTTPENNDFGKMYWYANDGAGNFSAPKDIDTSFFDRINQPQLADLDLDGDSDIIFIRDYSLGIFRSNGNGTFGPLETNPVGALNIAIGEIASDGYPDILIGAEKHLYHIKNDGSGHFPANPAEFLFPNKISWSSALVISDMNADGLGDLVSHYNGYGSTGCSVVYGTPEGEPGAYRVVYPTLDDPATLLADLDGDGLNDLLAASEGSSELAWFPNAGNATFPEKKVVDTTAYNMRVLRVADLNKDSIPDILGFMWFDGKLVWYPNAGSGKFLPRQTIGNFALHGSYLYFKILDWDGDNDLDILQLPKTPSRLFRNDGKGNFTVDTLQQDFYFGMTLDAMDYDGDGDTDLAVQAGEDLYWVLNDGKDYLYANPNPQPDSSFFNPVFSPISSSYDFDGNGTPDFLASSKNQSALRVSLSFNIGGGLRFDGWNTVGSGSSGNLRDIGVVDFDKDGDLDIYYTHNDQLNSTNVFYVVRNDGTGHFYPPEPLAVGLIQWAAFSDMDADGDADILYASQYELGWYRNGSEGFTIQGLCFNDLNGNKQFDTDEPPLPNIKLQLEPKAYLTLPNQDGYYRFYADTGQYTLTYLPDDCWERSTDSAAYHFAMKGNPVNNLIFGFKPAGNFSDAKAYLVTGHSVCTGVLPAWLVLYNHSCNPVKGTVSLRFSPGRPFSFSYDPATLESDSLTVYDFENLLPGEQRIFRFFMQNGGVPGYEIGDTLETRLRAVIQTPDGQPLSESQIVYEDVLACSWDPNDKSVDRSVLNQVEAAAGTELQYTIRFQNTGNAPAYNVVLRDTLDNLLDWASFQITGASHLFYPLFDENSGEIVFSSIDIFLPDSASDLAGSQGFVSFSIRTKPGMMPEEIVRNRAGIYFDLNPPVVTNWAETRISKISSIGSPKQLDGLRVVPNPASNELTLLWSRTAPRNTSVRIYDGLGSVVWSRDRQGEDSDWKIILEHLPPGIYFISINAPEFSGEMLKVVKL